MKKKEQPKIKKLKLKKSVISNLGKGKIIGGGAPPFTWNTGQNSVTPPVC